MRVVFKGAGSPILNYSSEVLSTTGMQKVEKTLSLKRFITKRVQNPQIQGFCSCYKIIGTPTNFLLH